MIEQETINRLLIDEDYYGSFGKQYLSNSDIGSLLNNPKDFRKPQPDNINFHKGRYFHQLILEPEKAAETKFVDVSSRVTKAYKEGNQYEVPMIKEIKGLLWKGKADIVCTDKLIDLKTTSKIADFKYSARKYNYDSQCYIYQILFGKPLVFYVVDKTNGKLGIFRPTEEFVRRGEAKVNLAVEQYHRFYGESPTEDIKYYYIDEML